MDIRRCNWRVQLINYKKLVIENGKDCNNVKKLIG